MEQSWNKVAHRSLRIPAFARKHCSIDLNFSFARGARHWTVPTGTRLSKAVT
jgi:hypothetical protein